KILTLVGFTAIMGFFLTSCQKDKTKIEPQESHKKVEAMSSTLNFKDYAAEVHNGYLAFLYTKYNDGTITSEKTLDNLEVTLDVCKGYFENNSNFNLDDWNNLKSIIVDEFHNPKPL